MNLAKQQIQQAQIILQIKTHIQIIQQTFQHLLKNNIYLSTHCIYAPYSNSYHFVLYFRNMLLRCDLPHSQQCPSLCYCVRSVHAIHSHVKNVLQ